MTLWGALAGGAVGTVVLTSGLHLVQETGVTRMDIPLLLGTVFTRTAAAPPFSAMRFTSSTACSSRSCTRASSPRWTRRAGSSGWRSERSTPRSRAGVLIDAVLPVVHPRMGTHWTDATETPLLESPGFMLFNYGRSTAVVTLALHLAYEAIGWAALQPGSESPCGHAIVCRAPPGVEARSAERR